MSDVMVSYAREDQGRAAELVLLLEAQGWDVFWDQDTRGGTDWALVLEETLKNVRCVVALWTTESVRSRWVRIEAYEAMQKDKLLPVLLDAVQQPLAFRQTQALNLTGWSGERDDPRLARLLSDLTALAGAPRRSAPQPPPQPPEPVPAVPSAVLAGADASPPVTPEPATAPPSHPPVSPLPVDPHPGFVLPARRTVLLALGGASIVGAVWFYTQAPDPGPGDAAAEMTEVVAEPRPGAAPQSVDADGAASPASAASAVPAGVGPTAVASAPTAVTQARPTPRPLPATPSAQCRAIFARVQLGEPLTDADRQVLQKECKR
ncbi:MAG: toll/interleukin-1 receptor domain-containing protein [Pseudomonadota bacterium]